MKIGAIHFQVENPDLHGLPPFASSIKDWRSLKLEQFKKLPYAEEPRKMLETRQSGISDENWQLYESLKKDEVFMQLVMHSN